MAYCLADVDLAAGAAACQQLLRLRLLPLADGSLAEFAAFGQLSKPQEKQPLVFVVTDELELLLVGSQSKPVCRQLAVSWQQASVLVLLLLHC